MRLVAGRPATDVEEVVQETWVRAITALDGFAGRSTLSTWLHGLALNVVRERRRRPEWASRTDDAREPIAPDPVTRDGDAEARIDLERGLARLPEGRRTVLVLHDLYGYSHGEVAGMLDVSIGTSKSQLHDARRQLESLLRGRMTDE